MADVPSGFVRVFVGPTSEDAARWMAERRERLAEFKPLPNDELQAELNADEVAGDGKELVLFRRGNVAVCSRSPVDAKRWAQAVGSSINRRRFRSRGPSRQCSSRVRTSGSSEPMKAPTTSLSSAARHPSKALLHFSEPPYRLISGDGWGRARRGPRSPQRTRTSAINHGSLARGHGVSGLFTIPCRTLHIHIVSWRHEARGERL